MVIDWFTVVAQAVNFLVLVWLMKRFLYRPILDAIAAREKRIADELADAAGKQAAALAEQTQYHDKIQAFEAERDALLDKARAEAQAERLRQVDAAREAGESLREKQAQALQAEREQLAQQLGRLASDEVFAVARKVLDDLADTPLESRMGEMLARRLRALDVEARASLAMALRTSETRARVSSRFDLPEPSRQAIAAALTAIATADVPLEFVTVADRPIGIELTVGGYKLAWSVADYLKGLQHKADALMAERASGTNASASTSVSRPESGA